MFAFLLSGRVEQALAPEPVVPLTWLHYEVVEDTVEVGGEVTLRATAVRSRIDCPRTGRREVVLYDYDDEIRTYEVKTVMPLIEGDLGTRETSGTSRLPPSIPPGRVGVRSIAVYTCPESTYIVVSPWADLTIVE